ncbi:NAD(P)-binding protein [Amniculicola lignicola CBS 123094]|uniref:NAD(P)-binding protein n=1 Tax=Amniculicola lignicola CBS 123094 TaxID=1392246 RepID=A0A6A5WNV1_9PLEO|nr:NAD(P)-binding protein [Amniculicola lignicola CBS 123094]
MVKIAVAGGTGNVATEILKSAIASGKQDITILTRSDPVLKGFDTVLSFLVVHLDEGCKVQRNLIQACVKAGVRRFAPSEWGIKNGSGVPPYKNKDEIAGYLKEINKDEQILQYTLFHPSIFLDYFAHPHPLPPSQSLITWPFFIDFASRRAMILDSGDQPLVLTAISDISQILALALEDERPWPEIGGIRGTLTSMKELVALGREIRGGDWEVIQLKGEDVKKGILTSPWIPQMSHPVIPLADREHYSREFVVTFLQGVMRGAWDVSGEFNERYPGYKFWGAREYLREAWVGRRDE